MSPRAPEPGPSRGGRSSLRGHREYRPGDDPRRIDWRVLARHDRVVVREHDAERDARTDVVLDASASMVPCGGREASLRAVAVAFAVALVDGGRARLLTLSEAGPVVRFAGDAPADLVGALGVLAGLAHAGVVDFASALPVLARSLVRGARIVLVSDFLSGADPSLLHGLGARARGGHVVHVRTAGLPACAPGDALEVVDAETGERRAIVATPDLLARVAARTTDHAARWARAAAQARLGYVPVSPATDPAALLRALEAGSA